MPNPIVIDTNVFIRACLKGRYQPLMGTALFLEYESILARSDVIERCSLPRKDIQALLSALMSVSRWVQVYYLWRPNLTDEADNHLIELAIAGNAEAIITQNIKDFQQTELLFPSLSIITPQSLIMEQSKYANIDHSFI
jgi:predicted nucleic acid-binding protein